MYSVLNTVGPHQVIQPGLENKRNSPLQVRGARRQPLAPFPLSPVGWLLAEFE